MVDARKYFGSTFVTLKDVADGPLRVTIDGVREGQYGKLVANFEEGLSLSLNATNSRILAKAYGPETDGWLGHVIELFSDEIEFKGNLQPAVLVKPVSLPTAPSAAPKPPPVKQRSDMDDDNIPF